jgi:hypothetical protein
MSPRRGKYFPKYSSFEKLEGAKPRQDISVSFTVMAHPSRAAWAVDLSREIGCGITWDKTNDRHDTGLRAISAFEPSATHHVVVQDDSILCKDFKDSVNEAVAYSDSRSPVCFYHGGSVGKNSAHTIAFEEAIRRNASWLVRKGPIWGPAIAYPTENIQDLIDYFRASDVDNYDKRVMKYYQSIGQDCWYTVPSLVDHRQDGNPSLCGHDRGVRRARAFAGPQSGLNVEWSGPVLRSRF